MLWFSPYRTTANNGQTLKQSEMYLLILYPSYINGYYTQPSYNGTFELNTVFK